MYYLDLFAGIGGFALGAYPAELRFEGHYFSEALIMQSACIKNGSPARSRPVTSETSGHRICRKETGCSPAGSLVRILASLESIK